MSDVYNPFTGSFIPNLLPLLFPSTSGGGAGGYAPPGGSSLIPSSGSVDEGGYIMTNAWNPVVPPPAPAEPVPLPRPQPQTPAASVAKTVENVPIPKPKQAQAAAAEEVKKGPPQQDKLTSALRGVVKPEAPDVQKVTHSPNLPQLRPISSGLSELMAILGLSQAAAAPGLKLPSTLVQALGR